jgi:hypothetical protein
MTPYNVMIKAVEYIYARLNHKMYEMNIYLCCQIIKWINNKFVKDLKLQTFAFPNQTPNSLKDSNVSPSER